MTRKKTENRCRDILIRHGWKLHTTTAATGEKVYYLTAAGMPYTQPGAATLFYSLNGLLDYCDRLKRLEKNCKR